MAGSVAPKFSAGNPCAEPLNLAALVAKGGAQVGHGEDPALAEAEMRFVVDHSQELWSRFAGCEIEVTVPLGLQQGKHHSLIR